MINRNSTKNTGVKTLSKEVLDSYKIEDIYLTILQPFIKNNKLVEGLFYERYSQIIRLVERHSTSEKDVIELELNANAMLEALAIYKEKESKKC